MIPAWHHLNEAPSGHLRFRFLFSAPAPTSEANKNTQQDHIFGAYSKAKRQKTKTNQHKPPHTTTTRSRAWGSNSPTSIVRHISFYSCSDLDKVPNPSSLLATQHDFYPTKAKTCTLHKGPIYARQHASRSTQINSFNPQNKLMR